MATTQLEYDRITRGFAAPDALVAARADGETRRTVRWAEMIKRGFDVTVGALGLILLTPLFLVIGVAIKLTDPGPVFYRHRRLSRVGKPTHIYKFRSMTAKYSTGEQFGDRTDSDVFAELGIPELAEEFARAQKLHNDPRVSRVGHFLRRNSLDELPQLWNILKGEISVVGPRPIVSAELDRYGGGKDTLLSLKPGLTGLWQISGRSDLDYSERVRLDLYYAENWSLLLDLKIMLRTLSVVVRRRGAY